MESATPPELLYKYLSPDREDVLVDGRIRFTPPLNTNDIFEVRQTFDLFVGPQMQAAFEERLNSVDLDSLVSAAKRENVEGIDLDDVEALIRSAKIEDFERELRSLVNIAARRILFPIMNTRDGIVAILYRIATDVMLLSLSESCFSSPMWAHYASNSRVFVVAFKATHRFMDDDFKNGECWLRKVAYFDGRLREILDAPSAALVSKQSDWAYEREWRLYKQKSRANFVKRDGGEEIRLVDFPPDAVQRVILGSRSSEALQERLKAVLSAKYPRVALTRVRADRSAGALVEEPA